MAHQTMYAATKAALNGLTLALRYELWDENIRNKKAGPWLTLPFMKLKWTDAPPAATNMALGLIPAPR